MPRAQSRWPSRSAKAFERPPAKDFGIFHEVPAGPPGASIDHFLSVVANDLRHLHVEVGRLNTDNLRLRERLEALENGTGTMATPSTVKMSPTVPAPQTFSSPTSSEDGRSPCMQPPVLVQHTPAAADAAVLPAVLSAASSPSTPPSTKTLPPVPGSCGSADVHDGRALPHPSKPHEPPGRI